jgi:hypothetical protein
MFRLRLCVSVSVALLFLINTGFAQNGTPLFRLLPAAQTGIHFKNELFENDTLNILNQANIYNGGGVGIGDFNNDGLPDVYFAGNMVSNKLYLNQGKLKFDDVTTAAGADGQGRWCTGVSVVDINNDGWLDIYVSASFRRDALRRTNLLYINQGLGTNNIPTFKESAKAYGIADTGYSTQGVFFDYDKDGDLDLYLVTNELNDPKTPIIYRPKVTNGSAKNTDRLYRNNGNGTFTDVSKLAGITIEGWGHAVSISDVNRDGWPDIYVANDFISNDLLYINNKNGTFTDRLPEYFKHTGWNAMGTDIVDINNDGYPDVLSLEMLPESNLRKKTMLRGDEYYNYFNSRQFGYTHQYVRNVLQLNSGPVPGGHPVFSDVAFMAGLYETDWSWTPLVADFDNDGYRDIVISNGLPRDVTDLDYIAFDNGQGGGAANLSLKMVDSLPVVKIDNYAFKNKNGLLFQNTTLGWGLGQSSFSNGAAYADLDNDGDLDLVINNINDPAFVYENTLNNGAQKKEQSIAVGIEGPEKNIRGFGSSITLYYQAGKKQYYEHQPCRGYLSTVDARAHFGMGTATNIDSLRVAWPDGKTQLLTNLKTNQLLTLHYKDAAYAKNNLPDVDSALFVNAANRHGIKFLHREKDAIDYNIQPTLPHKLSQYGPGIAVGDIDNNGYDDFFIGAASGYAGTFFMQDAQGIFKQDTTRIKSEGAHTQEDMGVLFFDADGDADLDLYVVSGSYEHPPYAAVAQDRLYLNDGSGTFSKAHAALPKITANGSCVRAADFDQDGDLDLFVGGRSVSGSYPVQPQSYLLKNEGGAFVDVTTQYAPDLQYIGMVTDALWSDFDKDGKIDLVLTGEWMPVTFFKNTSTGLVLQKQTGISQHTGWWNSLTAGDFDNDGDVDYVAGNLGLNSHFKATPEEPMTLLAKDLDENGKIDLMVFCYLNAEDSTRKPFPMHARDDMVSQLLPIRKKYPTYKAFGLASMDDLWREQDRVDAIKLQANNLQSSYIENKGKGQFAIKALPLEAQAAPVYGMVSTDVNSDGHPDLLMVGNDYGMEPGGGRHDAFNGLCLTGDGRGNFIPLPVAKSGFFVKGDGKGLAMVHTAKGEALLLATQNADSLMVYGKKAAGDMKNKKLIPLKSDDFCADITYKDGRKQRMEFYYGSTFLSQSSRRMPVDAAVSNIVITNFKGQKRDVAP